MSTYTQNVPNAPTTKIKTTQEPIKSNFNALFDAVDRNHISLNDTSNSGRHVVVEMEEQSGDPTPVSTYGSLYVKDDGGTQNLYMIDDASAIHQFTNAFTASANGQFIVPGGLIVKWGLDSFSGSGVTVTVNYPTPFTTSAYMVIATLVGGAQGISVSNTSLAASFNAQRATGSPSGQSFHWIAIGM